MPNYSNYTKQELIDTQLQLAVETGEPIQGALGGLPVVEQKQEYFVVFDEAGSTGPEIIDKTQLRVSYLVDSQLNTSKPVADTPSAFNTQQNFGKAESCVVRADNATVLNQNLTGKQTIYDVGTLALISTTETGKSNDDYTDTMSFNSVGGQTIGSAQQLASSFANNTTRTFASTSGKSQDQDTVFGDLNRIENLPDAVTEISQSIDGYEWVEFVESNRYIIHQDTVVAGTRLRFRVNAQGYLTSTSGNVSLNLRAVLRRNGVEEYLGADIFGSAASGGGKSGNAQNQNIVINGSDVSNFRNFNSGDEIFLRLIINYYPDDTATCSATLNSCTLTLEQETPPGDILIEGLNSTTAPYWSGFQTVGTSDNDAENFSILTASVEFTSFCDGSRIQKIDSLSQGFDPDNDGNVFNPIQTPLTFEPGDEIRFEFNKNKVHKVIKSDFEGDGLKLFIHPSVDTQQLNLGNSIGTQLNHFTHYRIIPDGGYIIIDKKKDNQAGVSQEFAGIITPENPSDTLAAKGDELIFELKTAGIIET